MAGGRRLFPRPELAALRSRAREELGRLPPRLLALAPATPPYPVEVSAGLAALRDELAPGLG